LSGAIIRVENLSRQFAMSEGRSGFGGSILNLFSRRHFVKKAIDNICFDVGEGEFVGYVGENGAGKSTTIKILTGILTPTSGRAQVAGIVPYESRAENAKNIGVVFGQRTQLWWDLPARESFDLLRSIYKIDDAVFRKNFDELSDALELGPLLNVPVRKLSLGQRMRCDIAAALLHGPRALFLDEPTIGLDVIAKDQVRKFLRKANKENGATIILTTHDMDDIEALCERIIILDEGKIAYDGPTEKLKDEFAREKLLEVELHDTSPELPAMPKVEVTRREGNRVWLKFSQDDVTAQEVISRILGACAINDISIHEPKVGDIVRNIYSNGLLKPAVNR
jgi:ABC-2 type transport system ATP-binding protein